MTAQLRRGFAEAITNIRRNPFMAAASVLVVAVSLYLVGGVLIGRFATNRVLELQTRKVEVAVFLTAEISNDQRDSIRQSLSAMDEVSEIVYESKEEAYKRFTEIFRDQPDVVENTDPSALPESFRVKLRNPQEFEVVRDRLEGRPGILRIQDYRSLLRQFFGVVNDITKIGLILVFLLAVCAATIVGTTIRLAIYARRREVAIMKLVGASNWFVRLPFMFEAAIQGITGAAIAVALLVYPSRPLFINVAKHIRFLHVNVSILEVLEHGAILLGFGILLGAVGSLLGLRRFLEV